VIVVAPGPAVLLQHMRTSDGWDGWITPGGGLEPGETAEAAARRELAEEVGLRDAVLMGPVWKRRHVFDWEGRRIDQREEFFLVHASDTFEVAGEADPSRLAAEGVVGHSWWSLEELSSARVVTAPRSLAGLVKELLERGAPATPLEVGE
jgi:8-oxo-dGTP pyrophosphatase MutT (NUDIX family)